MVRLQIVRCTNLPAAIPCTSRKDLAVGISSNLTSADIFPVQDELTAASYLEYDDYSNAKSALDAAQQVCSSFVVLQNYAAMVQV